MLQPADTTRFDELKRVQAYVHAFLQARLSAVLPAAGAPCLVLDIVRLVKNEDGICSRHLQATTTAHTAYLFK
jgi:hypothetical protein